MDKMATFFRGAFGNGYRFTLTGWNKLRRGNFYSPISHAKTIDGSKLFIIQTRDDKSVQWQPVARFAKQTHAQLWLLKSGGHLSTSLAQTPRFYRRIAEFLKQ
jgi:hypothetical protein